MKKTYFFTNIDKCRGALADRDVLLSRTHLAVLQSAADGSCLKNVNVCFIIL